MRRRAQSGQLMMIGVLIFLVLIISIPAIIFLNQHATAHNVISQKRLRGHAIAEEGLAFAVQQLSQPGTSPPTYWPYINAGTFPNGFDGTKTFQSSQGSGSFKITCTSYAAGTTPWQPYQVQVISRPYDTQGNLIPGASVSAFVSQRTVGAKLPTGMSASAALDMAQAPTYLASHLPSSPLAWDVFFTSADGVTPLNHEIQSYDSSAGQLVAWVKIPTLSSTVDTKIYEYYGNPASGDMENTHAVWSSYAAVWHLSDGNGTTLGNPIDSTGNTSPLAINNTGNGITALGLSSGVFPILDSGAGFPVSNYSLIPTPYPSMSSAFVPTVTNAYTVEAWVNQPVAFGNSTNIIIQSRGTGSSHSLTLGVSGIYGASCGSYGGLPAPTGYTNQYPAEPMFFDDANGVAIGIQAEEDIHDGIPRHLVGVWTNPNAPLPTSILGNSNQFKLYINGGVVGGAGHNLLGYCNVGSDATPLQGDPGGTQLGVSQAWNTWFEGSMAEVRVSLTARTADWIQTEYNNQSSPNTFISLGGEQTQSTATGAPWADAHWLYRRAITLKSNKVASPGQPNFPVMIQLPPTTSNMGTVDVEMGPTVCRNDDSANIGWLLDTASPDNGRKRSRKFSSGQIKPRSYPGSGTPTTDQKEYWAYTSPGFSTVIDLTSYANRAKYEDSIPRPLLSDGVTQLYPTGCAPGHPQCGYFVPTGDTAVFDNGYTNPDPHNVIYVAGNATFQNATFNLLNGAFIVDSSGLASPALLTLEYNGHGNNGFSTSVPIPPNAPLDDPYNTCGNSTTPPCNGNTARKLDFQGFLYVNGNLQIGDGNIPPPTYVWTLDGVVRVDGATSIYTSADMLLYYNDVVNHSILTSNFELQVDSMTAIP